MEVGDAELLEVRDPLGHAPEVAREEVHVQHHPHQPGRLEPRRVFLSGEVGLDEVGRPFFHSFDHDVHEGEERLDVRLRVERPVPPPDVRQVRLQPTSKRGMRRQRLGVPIPHQLQQGGGVAEGGQAGVGRLHGLRGLAFGVLSLAFGMGEQKPRTPNLKRRTLPEQNNDHRRDAEEDRRLDAVVLVPRHRR